MRFTLPLLSLTCVVLGACSGAPVPTPRTSGNDAVSGHFAASAPEAKATTDIPRVTTAPLAGLRPERRPGQHVLNPSLSDTTATSSAHRQRTGNKVPDARANAADEATPDGQRPELLPPAESDGATAPQDLSDSSRDVTGGRQRYANVAKTTRDGRQKSDDSEEEIRAVAEELVALEMCLSALQGTTAAYGDFRRRDKLSWNLPDGDLERGAELAEAALKGCDRMRLLQPRFYARVLAARISLLRGAFNRARSLFYEIMRLTRENSTLEPPPHLDNYHAALTHCRDANALEAFRIGEVLSARGYIAEATKAFDAVAQRGPCARLKTLAAKRLHDMDWRLGRAETSGAEAHKPTSTMPPKAARVDSSSS